MRTLLDTPSNVRSNKQSSTFLSPTTKSFDYSPTYLLLYRLLQYQLKMEAQKATGFLKSAYYQGHGRYINQIIRLTIKFCKSSGSSREMRKFIETKLVDTARLNSGCVIYVKPRLFKTPVLKADYLNGNEHYLNCHQMSVDQLEAWIGWFMTRSGYELYRLQRSTTTYRPSVQGIWTPFKFRNPQWNTSQFPSEEFGKHVSARPDATEQLLNIARNTKNVSQA